MQEMRSGFGVRVCVGAVVLGGIVACRSQPKPEEKSEVQVAGSVTSPEGKKADELEAQRAQSTAKSASEAEALLASWARAQNEGKLDDYEKLYASRFTGTKRAGSRTTRFDRAGWLEDRRAIFARPFTVTIRDPQVVASPDSAVIEFTQAFSTPTFQDEGKKRLVLTREGALKIASEEMLSSSLGVSAAEVTKNEPSQFSFVVQLARGYGIIVDHGVDQRAVSGGVEGIGNKQVERALSTPLLAPKWREWVGKSFDLYGEHGKTCSAKVVGFSALASVTPHFGTFSLLRERNEGVPDLEHGLALWQLSENAGRYLVARLEPQNCKDPLFARESSLSPPRIWKTRAPSPEETIRLKAAARSQTTHRSLQKLYTELTQQTTPWDELGQQYEKLAIFEDGEGRAYWSASLVGRAGGACNGEFFQDLWLLFKQQGQELILVSAAPEAHVSSPDGRLEDLLSPNLAFDLEGDGIPELVSPTDFFRSESGKIRAVWNISPGYFDCPC